MVITCVSFIFELPISLNYVFFTIAHFSITASLLSRWALSGHIPLTNLYESLTFLAWVISSLCLVSSTILKGNLTPPYSDSAQSNRSMGQSLAFSSAITPDLSLLGNPDKTTPLGFQKLKSKTQRSRIIFLIFSPVIVFLLGFSSFALPSEMRELVPLVPALQSNWLLLHVSIMLLSYGTLIFGSLLSLAFLMSKTSQFRLVLDRLSYRMLSIGFPLLTLGILSGSIWANQAWGSYWSWDPKETWALITWFVFAIYLHARLIKGWQGTKPAIIATFGFFMLWFCFLGVNILAKGLHSYAI